MIVSNFGLRRDGSTSLRRKRSVEHSPCTALHPEPVEGSVERFRASNLVAFNEQKLTEKILQRNTIT